MTPRPRPRALDEAYASGDGPSAAFTRVVLTPPGPPWRQRQVAELEARLGSPLRDEDVAHRIARTEPWRIGQAGRFAVAYARGAQPAKPLASKAAYPRRAAFDRRRLLALGVTLAALTLYVATFAAALGRRAEVREELSALDQALAPLQGRERRRIRLSDQARSLDALGAKDRSAERVLEDLDWASGHRRPEVSITGFHWLNGVVAVEAASAVSPFAPTKRAVQRAPRPLRPGVWLWGVGPSQAPAR